ncbi:hypothetical protein M440DRAFT_1406316 [Trichoderma longibrachiatum ATCC 18648]|uniref:Uncharacterized protein n=1 Tax=Trichoderma longibrachiatum ATCC 18648 TaxID=983965 RepID=A0A2T4BQI1_TRILO|nr:hypothetical protein M440DRAFT_1406316 [Trichoderma longibrachiatum ATCC 18648]
MTVRTSGYTALNTSAYPIARESHRGVALRSMTSRSAAQSSFPFESPSLGFVSPSMCRCYVLIRACGFDTSLCLSEPSFHAPTSFRQLTQRTKFIRAHPSTDIIMYARKPAGQEIAMKPDRRPTG